MYLRSERVNFAPEDFIGKNSLKGKVYEVVSRVGQPMGKGTQQERDGRGKEGMPYKYNAV